jgi:hypothetical protein
MGSWKQEPKKDNVEPWKNSFVLQIMRIFSYAIVTVGFKRESNYRMMKYFIIGPEFHLHACSQPPLLGMYSGKQLTWFSAEANRQSEIARTLALVQSRWYNREKKK